MNPLGLLRCNIINIDHCAGLILLKGNTAWARLNDGPTKLSMRALKSFQGPWTGFSCNIYTNVHERRDAQQRALKKIIFWNFRLTETLNLTGLCPVQLSLFPPNPQTAVHPEPSSGSAAGVTPLISPVLDQWTSAKWRFDATCWFVKMNIFIFIHWIRILNWVVCK